MLASSRQLMVNPSSGGCCRGFQTAERLSAACSLHRCPGSTSWAASATTCCGYRGRTSGCSLCQTQSGRAPSCRCELAHACESPCDSLQSGGLPVLLHLGGHGMRRQPTAALPSVYLLCALHRAAAMVSRQPSPAAWSPNHACRPPAPARSRGLRRSASGCWTTRSGCCWRERTGCACLCRWEPGCGRADCQSLCRGTQ